MSIIFQDIFGLFSQVLIFLKTPNAEILVRVFHVPTLALFSTVLSNFAIWAGLQCLIFLLQLLCVKFATETKSLIIEAHFFFLDRISQITGQSLSEPLIFASTNPQYDDRFFIELQVQYMLTWKFQDQTWGEHVVYRNCLWHSEKILYTTCSLHVLQKEELLTMIYL